MDKKDYYKYMFIIGAFWNWILSVSFIILSIVDETIFATFGITKPPTLFFLHALLILIFTFGIGYFIVGRDINNNSGIVILGIISKLAYFGCNLIYLFMGDLTLVFVVLAFGDFVFAMLYIEFMLKYEQ